MLNRATRDSLEQWLQAEQSGNERAAESALAGLFQSLPVASPIPGLADRVLAGTHLSRPRSWSWRSRALVTGAVASAGLAFVWLVPLVAVFVQRFEPSKVVSGAIEGLVGLTRSLVDWFSFWIEVADFIDTLLVVVTAPPVALTMILTGCLAALLTRGLVELVASDRSPQHV